MAGRNNVVYASSSFTCYFKAAKVKLAGSIKQKVSDFRFEIYSKIREKLFGMNDFSNHAHTGSSQARIAPLNSKSEHLSTRVTYPLWISDIFFSKYIFYSLSWVSEYCIHFATSLPQAPPTFSCPTNCVIPPIFKRFFRFFFDIFAKNLYNYILLSL